MIIRAEKNQNYSTIANFALNDPNLSLKAKGLWAFIMSKPNDWNISSRGLESQLKESRNAIMGILRELEKAGYLKRGTIRNKNGKYSQGENTMYEKPWLENPTTANEATYINTDNKLNTENKEKKEKKEKTQFSFGAVVGGKEKQAKEKPAGLPAAPGYLLKELIQIVNPNERPTEDRQRMLNGRLKEYTIGEIKGAARALHRSTWHRENKQMSIDNLLAPKKFGRWYAQRSETADDVRIIDDENMSMAEREKLLKERMGNKDVAD